MINSSPMSVGQFNKRVEKETSHLLQANGEAIEKTIAASDISALPKPVANWLRQCGALGKTFIHAAKLTQSLSMQMKPGQQKWLPGQALQYTTINKPGFVWSVRVRMNRLLYFVGRDKFENGRGEMLIRLNGWLKIVDAKGPKIDEGALQRYLGEMVWFPSLALSPYISWKLEEGDWDLAEAGIEGNSFQS